MNKNGIEYTSNVNVQLRVSEVFFPAIAAGLFKVQKKTFTSIKHVEHLKQVILMLTDG